MQEVELDPQCMERLPYSMAHTPWFDFLHVLPTTPLAIKAA
jgi:hypothetical protein